MPMPMPMLAELGEYESIDHGAVLVIRLDLTQLNSYCIFGVPMTCDLATILHCTALFLRCVGPYSCSVLFCSVLFSTPVVDWTGSFRFAFAKRRDGLI